MSTNQSRLVAVAQAEDTYDLMNHIAWTDVVRPDLESKIKSYSKLLVAEALGTPLPGDLTREKVAGMCYGLQYVMSLFESILTKGEKAVKDINAQGVALS